MEYSKIASFSAIVILSNQKSRKKSQYIIIHNVIIIQIIICAHIMPKYVRREGADFKNLGKRAGIYTWSWFRAVVSQFHKSLIFSLFIVIVV